MLDKNWCCIFLCMLYSQYQQVVGLLGAAINWLILEQLWACSTLSWTQHRQASRSKKLQSAPQYLFFLTLRLTTSDQEIPWAGNSWKLEKHSWERSYESGLFLLLLRHLFMATVAVGIPWDISVNAFLKDFQRMPKKVRGQSKRK